MRTVGHCLRLMRAVKNGRVEVFQCGTMTGLKGSRRDESVFSRGRWGGKRTRVD